MIIIERYYQNMFENVYKMLYVENIERQFMSDQQCS